MRSKEQFDVNVDQGAFNVAEFEHFRDGSEGRQTKSRADSQFGSSSDKELDTGYLLDRMAEAGSSSLHSSRASMMVRVEMWVTLNGPTMSPSIYEQRVSRPTPELALRT